MAAEKSSNQPNAKQAILETAAKLFSELGYAGTTMRDIADAVGVLPGSLYAHIKNKESLLYTVVQSGIQKFLELETAIASAKGSPDEDLRSAIKFHVAVVAESPYTQVVFHQWRFLSAPMRKKVVDMRRRYADVFRKILERGIEDGVFNPRMDISLEILSLLGSLNWIPEWYSKSGPFGPEEIGDKLADTLLHGICLKSVPAQSATARGRSAARA